MVEIRLRLKYRRGGSGKATPRRTKTSAPRTKLPANPPVGISRTPRRRYG